MTCMKRLLGLCVVCALVAGCGGDDASTTATAAETMEQDSGSGESAKARCGGDGYIANIDTSSGGIEVNVPCGDVTVPGKFGDAVFVKGETPCVMLDVQPVSGSPERRVVCGTDDPNGENATPRDCINQLGLPADDVIEQQELSRLLECFDRTNAPESLARTWSRLSS